MKSDISTLKPKKILLRSTNWIGDAIMTTPAVRTVRENFPDAEIAILVHPWVADVFSASPHINTIIPYHKKTEHRGVSGMWRLGRELAGKKFDLAILLQNAFEAALIACFAGITNRAGYSRDCRGVLLTHPVTIPSERRKKHQVHYYQELLADLGLRKGSDELFLAIAENDKEWAASFLKDHGAAQPVIGLNPGAAYGPAKRWPARMYGDLAAAVAAEFGATVLIFGTAADTDAAQAIAERSQGGRVIDLTGRTSLAQAMALIEQCDVFVTNDSGLMHVAAALHRPLVAIFGSTDPVATGPYAAEAHVIRKELDCSPCLQTHCKRDFTCMKEISVAEVFAEVAAMVKAP